MAVGDKKPLATKEWIGNQIVDNVTSTDPSKLLSANQGNVLDAKINSNKTTVYNGLGSTSTTSALSAYQGYLLNNNVNNKASKTGSSSNYFNVKPPISTYHAANKTYVDNSKTVTYNGLGSTSTTYALTAAQGRILGQNQSLKQHQVLYLTYGGFSNQSLLIGNMQFTTTGNGNYPVSIKFLKWGGSFSNQAGAQLYRATWNSQGGCSMNGQSQSMYPTSWQEPPANWLYQITRPYTTLECWYNVRGNAGFKESYKVTMVCDGSNGIMLKGEYTNNLRRSVA